MYCEGSQGVKLGERIIIKARKGEALSPNSTNWEGRRREYSWERLEWVALGMKTWIDVVDKGKEELRIITAWINVCTDILFMNVTNTEINLSLDWADIEFWISIFHQLVWTWVIHRNCAIVNLGILTYSMHGISQQLLCLYQ